MKKVVSFFLTRRVAVYLILAVAALALIGVVIPQNEPPSYYKAHYQGWVANALNILKLSSIYNAWYFAGALSVLTLAVLVCLAVRLPGIVSAFKWRERARGIPRGAELKAEIGLDSRFGEASRALRSLHFRWKETDGVLYGRKRPYAGLGMACVHVGVLVIATAVALKPLSHREEVFVFQGQGLALSPAYGEGFEVWADAVEESRDGNTGKVLESRTRLRLLRYGEEITAEEVQVNRPLRGAEFDVYQSSMETAARGLALEAVELKEGVRGEDFGRAVFTWVVGGGEGEVTLAPGETAALGGTGFYLRYLEYYERFTADESGFRDDGADYNPAAFIHLVNPEGATAIGTLFKTRPEQSFVRADVPDFAKGSVTITYAEDAGPWRRGRREFLLASGSRIVVGDAALEVKMGGGTGSDLRYRSLKGVLRRADGGEESFEFPFGARVYVEAGDARYLFRFTGSKSAPVVGLVIVRDPGLGFFYVGGVLLTLGVVGASLLRFDELWAYVSAGKVFVVARSSKGSDVLKRSFDRWVEAVRREL